MTSSPERVRIAMIGAGAMATRAHYPSLATFPDVEIAGIWTSIRPGSPRSPTATTSPGASPTTGR